MGEETKLALAVGVRRSVREEVSVSSAMDTRNLLLCGDNKGRPATDWRELGYCPSLGKEVEKEEEEEEEENGEEDEEEEEEEEDGEEEDEEANL